MMTPKTTRSAVLSAIEECDQIGETTFLAKYGFRGSEYRILVGEKDYPSKAILGVASGLSAKEFSGGAAHTARVLSRLGFDIVKRAHGAIASVLALVAGVAAFWSYEAPAMPAGLPIDPVATFASGSNRPGEIRAFGELGHDIGVAAPEVSAPSEAALSRLAGTDIQVFLDSGAFSEVEFGPNGPTVVHPIDDAAWKKRLALAARLAVRLGDQLHVVAPDRVGCQKTTLERMARYAPEIQHIHALGARILVPVQKGEMSQAAFFVRAKEILGIAVVPALPCKKAATTAAEVREFCRIVRPRTLHLLGLGVRNAKAFDYLHAVAGMVPACQLTVDSNIMAAHVGMTGGRNNGPRRVTLARRWGDRLVVAGRMAKKAVMEFAVLLAFGGRELADPAQSDEELRAIGMEAA